MTAFIVECHRTMDTTTQPNHPIPTGRLSSGIAGLDEVLSGGFIPNQSYLVRGGPGSGKTTLGLHFLEEGARQGEKTLFINMSESEAQLRQNAAGRFSLENVFFLDLSPSADFFAEIQAYDVFSPADVEREPTTNRITTQVRELRPARIFLDAMTHFRYLANETNQFRRQVHSFLRFLTDHGATVMFTSEGSTNEPDDDLQYMADGIVNLVNIDRKRTLSISKFRGSDFLNGPHTISLLSEGMVVYPRLIPRSMHEPMVEETVSSGIPEIDELLHGGIERSTITIVSGPTGIGKTTFALQFMKEAAGRGENSLVYTFEEWEETLLRRAESVNIPIQAMVKRGTLMVNQIEPLHYTPDSFAHKVRTDVEQYDAKIVMIDSIAGYRISMQGEDLISHLHGLCKYLQSIGVAVIIINEIQEITGNFQVSDLGISYIADNIIFMRYLEVRGEIRRAIGVLKKRLTDFEKSLREFTITRYGFKVGQPLTDLRGILTGTPDWDEINKSNGS